MQDDTAFGACLDLLRDLRQRCDWDRMQTRETLRPYLREEVAELDEALAADDDAEIAAELGDLLLHLCFQLVIAEERGAFTFADVADTLTHKMKRRHPHLFAGEPKPEWERLKAEERLRRHAARGEEPSRLGHLPPGLLDKLEEEVRETRERPAEEIGDVLFAAVNVARKAGVHPSNALRHATEKFARRFRAVERKAEERGVDMGRADLAALDRLWDEVKEGETPA